MIAQSIDPATATVIAAVVALIGTIAANTYTTAVQGRQKVKEQRMRIQQAYWALYLEMAHIFRRLVSVSVFLDEICHDFHVCPENATVPLFEAIVVTTYEKIRADQSLFFSIPNAVGIDRFYISILHLKERFIKYMELDPDERWVNPYVRSPENLVRYYMNQSLRSIGGTSPAFKVLTSYLYVPFSTRPIWHIYTPIGRIYRRFRFQNIQVLHQLIQDNLAQEEYDSLAETWWNDDERRGHVLGRFNVLKKNPVEGGMAKWIRAALYASENM